MAAVARRVIRPVSGGRAPIASSVPKPAYVVDSGTENGLGARPPDTGLITRRATAATRLT